MLKIDKKGNILRPNGTVLGAPKKTGNIYRSSNRTGRIDLETGDVFDLKEQLLGRVDGGKFEILKEASRKEATLKEVSLKEATCKINKQKEIAVAKTSKKSKKSKNKSIKTISAPATKSEPKIESKNTYVPGLDSKLIVSGKLGNMLYKTPAPTAEEKALEEINKRRGWKYIDWDDLSRKEDLTDSELERYELYVNWYYFLSMHPDREFNDTYKKKFKQHLILRTLNLIPYNGTQATKSEEYKASSIKEDRKRAEHIKELKAKREARKKIRAEE